MGAQLGLPCRLLAPPGLYTADGVLNAVLAAQLAHLNNLAGHGVGEGRDVWTQRRGSRGVLCFQQCLARLLEEVLLGVCIDDL